MKAFLSPKELADAIGVSESSLKRWADDGRLAVSRTAGGHRRIAREEAVRFVRRAAVPVMRPELLGFPELTASRQREAPPDEATQASLYEALTQGDGAAVAGILLGPFLAGRPAAALFDGPVRGAMHRIGELWQHREDGIFLEHRATDLCVQAIVRLRASLPAPPPGAPAAVGGAGPADPYLLPTLMAATVLREAGYADVNLGPDTPLDTIRLAARRHQARLAWLSVSADGVADALRRDLLPLADALGHAGAALVIGGRAAPRLADLHHPALLPVGSMAELSAFARGLLAAPAAGGQENLRQPG